MTFKIKCHRLRVWDWKLMVNIVKLAMDCKKGAHWWVLPTYTVGNREMYEQEQLRLRCSNLDYTRKIRLAVSTSQIMRKLEVGILKVIVEPWKVMTWLKHVSKSVFYNVRWNRQALTDWWVVTCNSSLFLKSLITTLSCSIHPGSGRFQS